MNWALPASGPSPFPAGKAWEDKAGMKPEDRQRPAQARDQEGVPRARHDRNYAKGLAVVQQRH